MIKLRKKMAQSDFYPVIFDIVNSYTRHKVLQRRFSAILQNGYRGEANCPSQCAGLIIKFLGEDIADGNRKIKAVFSTAAADRIVMEHTQLFSDAAYQNNFRISLESLPSVVKEMGYLIFKEKQHLGTVAAFLGFGASLAAYCESMEHLGVAAMETVVESITHYYCRHIESWLRANGGVDMLQSARMESQDHFAQSRKRKVNFSYSLKLMAEQSYQADNPQFYIETCQLILQLQHLLKIDSSETWFDYGMFLFGKENFLEAKNALENAIKGFDTHGLSTHSSFLGQCHFQVGVIDSHLGHFSEAVKCFQKACKFKIMDGNTKMSSAICHHWQGYVYRRMEDFNKALEAQKRALKEMEQNTTNDSSRRFLGDVYLELGCIHHEFGNIENAASFLEKCLSIHEEQVGCFKPKLQLYIHLAQVLHEKSIKCSESIDEWIQRTLSLLEKAVTLCLENSHNGHFHDKFPVVMFAHTDRIEKLEDILPLALKLCSSLSSVFGEENETAKKRLKKIQKDFEYLLSTLVKAAHQDQHPNSLDDGSNRGEECDQHQPNERRREAEKVVPLEIQARGRLALQAYNKALIEGNTCVRRVPIMLIGQDHSGKTSLKNSLTGKRFNRRMDSTVGIDVDSSHFKVTTELWKTGVKSEVTDSVAALSCEHHAGRLAVEMLRQDNSVPMENVKESAESRNAPLVDTHETNEDLASVPSHVPVADTQSLVELSSVVTNPGSDETSKDADPAQTPSGEESSNKNSTNASVWVEPNLVQRQKRDLVPLVEPLKPEEIVALIERLLKDVKYEEDEEEIYSVLWDFGGQSVYYATHPIFLTARAMYLLVYDLSRDPHQVAKPVVRQGTFRKFEDSFGAKTNLDYLDFWMASVASFGGTTESCEVISHCEVLPEKLPPVFLVCTHADQPHGGRIPSALAQEIFSSLQAKPYRTHLFDGVFAVDNTKSGLEIECPEVTRLRKEVLAVAKKLPQVKEAIPIKWLNFERALKVAREQGQKWITLEGARQIATHVCKVVDNKQFQALLNFFHDQRILIHFDDTPELDKMVILDPQWLTDVFKKVITIRPYSNQEEEFKELWFQLEATGILEEKLLKHLWDPLFDNKETVESLVALMEKFSLLCPWLSSSTSPGKHYLVPSMLMSHPPEDIIKLVASAQIPSLFIKFESGQVPPGLFPRLVLQFFQWGKDGLWSPVNPQLYQNFARFYKAGEEDCSVILRCHSSSVEIVFHRAKANFGLTDSLQSIMNLSTDLGHDRYDVVCALNMHRQVVFILESMRKEFCWLTNMKYDSCVMCSVCCRGGTTNFCRIHRVQSCTQEECLHFWSESQLLSEKHIVVCTRSAVALNNRVHVNQLAPWFAYVDEQVVTDERDSAHVDESGEKFVALPGKVVESLLSRSCDPKEIIRQLNEELQLNIDSLKRPEPETRRMIRCLARKAKSSNRFDVVRHLREITPAGTTGPILSEQLDVRNVPVTHMRNLTIYLSGSDEWKVVAEKLGLTPREIRFLDNRTLNPCDAALGFIANRRHITVGSLYDVLIECGCPMIADDL